MYPFFPFQTAKSRQEMTGGKKNAGAYKNKHGHTCTNT